MVHIWFQLSGLREKTFCLQQFYIYFHVRHAAAQRVINLASPNNMLVLLSFLCPMLLMSASKKRLILGMALYLKD